jgi:hypothetical protein
MPTMIQTKRHGMTLPELIIGSVMIAMLGTALASFTTAMAAGWKNSDQQFKIENASKRSGDALESTLSNMLYVAQYKSATTASPGSYVFYWNQDNGADKKAQLGEMALVEYATDEKAVWLYKPKSTLTLSQQTTLNNENWGDPTSAAIVTYFKGLDSIERTPVVGGAASGIDVSKANFNYFAPTGSKPMTSYNMTLVNSGAEDTSSGTIPLRASKKPTNFN